MDKKILNTHGAIIRKRGSYSLRLAKTGVYTHICLWPHTSYLSVSGSISQTQTDTNCRTEENSIIYKKDHRTSKA